MAHWLMETEHIKPYYQTGAAFRILKKGLMHWSCQTPWGIRVKSFVDLRFEKEDQSLYCYCRGWPRISRDELRFPHLPKVLQGSIKKDKNVYLPSRPPSVITFPSNISVQY